MKQKNKGFTLLEVVLVLAIAGAIFAAIFIALAGVWADERDNERRTDVLTFIRQLKNYQTNNSRGALPGSVGDDYNIINDKKAIEIIYNKDSGKLEKTNSQDTDTSWFGFYNSFFDENFVDPDGPRYNLRVTKCSAKIDSRCIDNELDAIKSGTFSSNKYSYTLFVVTEAVCDGEDAKKSANTRNVAVLYRMEAGGVYCENT